MEHFEQYPNLTGVTQIALDLETHDPHLKTQGIGGVRNDGEVLGFALAWRDPSETRSMFGLAPGVKSLYFPIAHASGNLDRIKVLTYLNSIFSRGIPVVGAHLTYDLEWARQAGVMVHGPKLDIQIAEVLLDENQKSYKLDTLAMSYLAESKLNKELFEMGVVKLGCKPEKVIENLKRLPAEDVAEYARTDAELTLRIWELQAPKLTALGLDTVWNLECQLVHVLQAMRWKGIRLDRTETVKLRDTLAAEERELMSVMTQLCTREVNPWSQDSVQAAATKLGLTGLIVDGKKKQSFPAPWMAKQDHPFFKHLLKLRQLSKVGGAFLGNFLELEHNGKLHCQFHQTRTVTGRLSCSIPNLQQIPARNEELAPKIRALFLPDEGKRLVSFDMSQIELRILLHYANALELPKAAEAVDLYTKDSSADFYAVLSEAVGISRFVAKTLFLSISYGASKNKVAEVLGMTMAEVSPLYEKFHAGAPYLKLLGKVCTEMAERRGWVKTISGRRRNFTAYGPRKYETGMLPLPREEAIAKWGPGVVRWFTYRAGNSVVQGSAADIMKRNLVDLYIAGYTPHISIHDEVLFSIEYGEVGDRDIENIKKIMENPTGIKLTVPLLVNVKIGNNWGNMT